jgi:hypothetical protein
MLVLNRKEGQWVEITHRSGEVLRVRFYNIMEGRPGRLSVAFDDDARNFKIHRPERRHVWEQSSTPRPMSSLAMPADAVTALPESIVNEAPTA